MVYFKIFLRDLLVRDEFATNYLVRKTLLSLVLEWPENFFKFVGRGVGFDNA